MAMLKKLVKVGTVVYENGTTALSIATFRKIEGTRNLKRGSSWGIVYGSPAELASIVDALKADLDREVARVNRAAKVAA